MCTVYHKSDLSFTAKQDPPTKAVFTAAWKGIVYDSEGWARNALVFISGIAPDMDEEFEKWSNEEFLILPNSSTIGNKREDAPADIDETTKILQYSGKVYTYTIGWKAFCDLLESNKYKEVFSFKIV